MYIVLQTHTHTNRSVGSLPDSFTIRCMGLMARYILNYKNNQLYKILVTMATTYISWHVMAKGLRWKYIGLIHPEAVA